MKNECIKRIVHILATLFVTVVAFVCLKGLVQSTNSFVKNQKTFAKAYSDAAAEIAKLPPKEKEAAITSIEHLERLQQIQKNAASSDVMSFLYSTLSTMLVALCAGFVAKSRSNAKEANDDASKSKDSAAASNTYAKKAKEAAQQASQYFIEAKEALVKAEASYNEALLQMQQQKDTMCILNIHIEIVHARAALFSNNQTGANQRIYHIHRLGCALTPSTERKAILQVQQEFLNLLTAVDQFREYADSLPDGGKKTSIFQAIERYINEINEVIGHCDMLLRS